MMKLNVLIDADGCPVVNIAVQCCARQQVQCLILCDTAHRIEREGAQTMVIDKDADSVDYAVANRANPGDIVITQDYGLAALCLAKGAVVLHQDGWQYSPWNIDALLFQRHEAGKLRSAGVRMKGPKKRGKNQDAAFEKALTELLSKGKSGVADG